LSHDTNFFFVFFFVLESLLVKERLFFSRSKNWRFFTTV